jgi:hypothetical protein
MLAELVRRDLLRPLRAPVPVGCLCVCQDAEPAMDESRLKQIRPFAGLSIAERKLLALVVDEFRAPAGTTLVSQGDYGYEFMVIEEGTVDVIRDGERIATMGPGASSASWQCSPSAASATRASWRARRCASSRSPPTTCAACASTCHRSTA